MENFWTDLTERFDADSLGASVAALLPKIIAAALVALLFWGLWWIAKRILRTVENRSRLDRTSISFVRTTTKALLLVVALIASLGQLGVDTSSLLASLGIAGLTIGFAARDALSNIISGLLIYWDRPFVIGDLVEVQGHYGRVDAITLRSTRVVTPDGKMLAVPNTTVINSIVTSYTNFPHLRLDVPIQIGVGEDIGRARQLLVDMLAGDERYMADPPPEVVVTALGDYNVTLELHVWIHDEKMHIVTRTALREEAFATLRDAGVDMPYETFQLMPVDVRTGAGKAA